MPSPEGIARIGRYAALLARHVSPVGLLDVRRLSEEVPLPPPPPGAPPAFVCGGSQDRIVDVPAVRELAAYCGVEPLVLEGHAHDLMLVRTRALPPSIGP